MAIIRVQHNKHNPYVITNKKTLEIPHLSWEAKGLWAYLLSRPDTWKTNVKHLHTGFPGGRDRIRRILKELMVARLCQFVSIKSVSTGRWDGADYVIYETPFEFRESLPSHELELTKCLPDPENATPENTGPYKVRNILIKELPKGSKKDVAAAPSPLISFGEFKRVKLTKKDYDCLVEKFGRKKLEELITSVDGNYEERGITRKNYKASIMNWERREKTFNPQSKKEDIAVQNKCYAKKIIQFLRSKPIPKDIIMEDRSEYIELGSTEHPSRKHLKFSERGFKDQLDSLLRKMDLIKYLT